MRSRWALVALLTSLFVVGALAVASAGTPGPDGCEPRWIERVLSVRIVRAEGSPALLSVRREPAGKCLVAHPK